MLRVSKLTDYATVVMTCLAEDPNTVHSATGIAERVHLELPTVSKLLKTLSQAGLVQSFRGANGGYRLAHDPASISIADIVTAMEGPFGMTECSVQSGLCNQEPSCSVRGNWRRISQVIEDALRSMNLAQMTQVPPSKKIPLRVNPTQA